MTTRNLMGGAAARLFLPITKIDTVQRLIYARITDETVDAAKEICDYDTSAPLFAKWSENAEKVSGGKSKGNLRAMHGPKAAGKLTELIFDDEAKTIDCVTKVVDDAEWEKVEEGVYTGLSLGGNYVGKKWKDESTGAMRYTVDPVEVSLVDLPCNSSAVFAMIKAEGVEIEAPFKPWEPTTEEIGRKATEIAKAIGPEEPFMDHLDDARVALIDERVAKIAEEGEPVEPVAEEPAAQVEKVVAEDAPAVEEPAAEEVPTDWGVEQVFRVKADGSVHAKKADAKAHVEGLQAATELLGADALAIAIAKAKGTAPAAAAEDAEPVVIDVAALKAAGEEIRELGGVLKLVAEVDGADGLVFKSMWMVSRFADALDTLASIQCSAAWEAEYEGDGSPVPGMIADGLKALASAFKSMAEEEVSELLSGLKLIGVDVIEVITLAAKPETEKALLVMKALAADETRVAKFTAAEPSLKTAAIALAEKLGATLADPEAVEKLTSENGVLKGQIEAALPQIAELGETIGKFREELDVTKKRLAEVSNEPAPMPVIKSGDGVVNRNDPAGADETEKALQSLIEKMPPEDVARLVIKIQQARPLQIAGA